MWGGTTSLLGELLFSSLFFSYSFIFLLAFPLLYTGLLSRWHKFSLFLYSLPNFPYSILTFPFATIIPPLVRTGLSYSYETRPDRTIPTIPHFCELRSSGASRVWKGITDAAGSEHNAQCTVEVVVAQI